MKKTLSSFIHVGALLAVCAALALAGCGGDVRGVALLVECPSVAAMEGSLGLRLPNATFVKAATMPRGLWRDLPLPPDDIAVLGFRAEAAKWRFSPAHLRGDNPGRAAPPLSRLARRLLERFSEHALLGDEFPEEHWAGVHALHVTRALATELIGKFEVPVLLARFRASTDEEAHFAAAAVHDVLDLAGPRAASFVWLEDGRTSRVAAFGSAPHNPSRAKLIAALVAKKE